MENIVGIGGMAVSNSQGDVIKTFSLASCVAVTVYCPVNRTAGMVHVALPKDNGVDCNDVDKPCYYATQAIPLLIKKMCIDYQCSKSDLQIELFGGAESINKDDVFRIGKKNIVTIKKILNELNLKYKAVEIGGTISRTLVMDVSTGETLLITQPLII